MYAYRDIFIVPVNELSKSANSGAVGAGLRYAAADTVLLKNQYKEKKLSEEKSEYIKFFTNTFTEMSLKNPEKYSRIQLLQKLKRCSSELWNFRWLKR